MAETTPLTPPKVCRVLEPFLAAAGAVRPEKWGKSLYSHFHSQISVREFQRLVTLVSQTAMSTGGTS
jgi:hypothetical protein